MTRHKGEGRKTMKAIVYKKPNKVSVETVPDPTIEASTDARVKAPSRSYELMSSIPVRDHSSMI